MRLCAVCLLVLLAACAPQQPGKLTGRVTFTGTAPQKVLIDMDAEADCVKLHKEPVYDEPVVQGPDGGLANALVYVKSGLEGKKFEPAQNAVVIDQKGCQFVPRVVAVQIGQVITVKNSDPVSHNIHPMPQNNRDWNQQQSPGAADLKRKFGFAEVMIPVKCNIHKWMKSYIGVMDHPFFQVTGPDGRYSLDGLPPGKYTVAVWHETLGTQTQEVTITASQTGTADFALRQ